MQAMNQETEVWGLQQNLEIFVPEDNIFTESKYIISFEKNKHLMWITTF